MDGAQFQIVLVDDSTTPENPTKPDSGVGPAPTRTEPPKLRDPWEKTDRGENTPESGAAPGESTHGRKHKQLPKDDEPERDERIERIKSAGDELLDLAHVGSMVRDASDIIGRTKTIIQGGIAVFNLARDAQRKAEAAAEASKSSIDEDPEEYSKQVDAAMAEVASNTDPSHIERAADRIVAAIEANSCCGDQPVPPVQPPPFDEEHGAPSPTATVPKVQNAVEEATKADGAAEGAVNAAEGAAQAGSAASAAGGAEAAGGAGMMAMLTNPVTIALVAVGAAAVGTAVALDALWDAAKEQRDELEEYSYAISKQKAETQIRREQRLIDRADERGDKLAHFGEAQDRIEEAMIELKDSLIDFFVDRADVLVPAIETIATGVVKTGQTIDVISATTGFLQAIISDYLNLAGTEAQQDASVRQAQHKVLESMNKLMSRQEQRERRKDALRPDPMLQMLQTAWGDPTAIDPQMMQDWLATLKGA